MNTVGSQTLTATDAVNSAGSGSTTIVVTSAGIPRRSQGTVYDDLNGNGARDWVGNLIVNGDFSAGNTGFQSQYTYNATSVVNETVYTVGPNPADFSPYVASFGDHTSGSGLMMIVNGGSVPTQAGGKKPFPYRQTPNLPFPPLAPPRTRQQPPFSMSLSMDR